MADINSEGFGANSLWKVLVRRDGGPVLKAGVINKRLPSLVGELDWPAKSPDLNPSNALWSVTSILKSKQRDRRAAPSSFSCYL